MAITVTATASGSGAINGLFLAVRVLNNAALTQSGSVAQSVTATKPQLPITPGTSGSLVYGVAAVGTSGTAFSSLLANTTSIFASSLVGGEYWGAYRSSAATTTSPTTYGWGNPTETSGTLFVACAEIQSNGSTLTEDASTPAVASSGAAKTVTTASFTPPAGSVLVALVGSNWSGSSTLTQAVTDSAGAYTWTPLVQASASAQVSVVWVGIPAGTTVNAGLAQATATALAPAPERPPRAVRSRRYRSRAGTRPGCHRRPGCCHGDRSRAGAVGFSVWHGRSSRGNRSSCRAGAGTPRHRYPGCCHGDRYRAGTGHRYRRDRHPGCCHGDCYRARAFPCHLTGHHPRASPGNRYCAGARCRRPAGCRAPFRHGRRAGARPLGYRHPRSSSRDGNGPGARGRPARYPCGGHRDRGSPGPG